MPDFTLDTSGLLCPQPLLQTRLFLQDLKVGQTLLVISTDPSSVIDFKVFAERGQVMLENFYQQANKYFYLLRKA